MKTRFIALATITVLLIISGLAYFDIIRAETWGEAQVFNGNTTFNGTNNHFATLRVGTQGAGGVTFFDGSIANDSTSESGDDNPITFGDNVRVDGAIFRIEAGGDNPVKLTDSMIPTSTNAHSLGTDGYRWRDGYFTGTLYVGDINGDGVISTSNLADAAVTGAKIADNSIGGNHLSAGSVGTADIADDAVTTDKINNGAIETENLADDAVDTDNLVDDAVDNDKVADDAIGRAQISGNGDANLPIAYGICVDQELVEDYSTSNVVACDWNAEQSYYTIEVSGETINIFQYVVSVTPITGPRIPQVDSVLGKLQISFLDLASAKQQASFSFVIYKR